MKPRVFLTILVMMTLFLPSFARAERVTPSERVTGSVKVKAAPRSGSSVSIVGRMRPGDSALLLDKVPYYYHIRLDNNVEGYVSKAWTSLIPGGNPPTAASLEIHFIGNRNFKRAFWVSSKVLKTLLLGQSADHAV